MPKSKAKPRVPRTRAGGEWTESRFFLFIRSALRNASMRFPPIARQALDRVKRPYQGDNPRAKWEYQCECCRNWFMRKHVKVDHIDDCGPMNKFDDLPGYVERMFCEPEKLRIICDGCHSLRHEKRESDD